MIGVRAFAQAFVKKAAIEGLSANATLDILRKVGLGYRRTDFLADFRLYKKIPKLSDTLKHIRKSYRPSKNMFLQPKKWMSRKYAFVTKFRVFKPETGETFTISSRVSSDRILTRGSAERKAIQQVKEAFDRSKFEITSYYLSEAWHRAGSSWL